MTILEDGVWLGVSTVIGVCGENFCSLLGDTRRTVNTSGDLYSFHDDNTTKVFKINKNLVYGVTGLIAKTETLLTPLSTIKDLSKATIDDAYNAVLADFEAKKYTMPKARNYIIGGRDLLGHFTLIYIHCNFDSYKPETRVFKPSANQFGVACALPERLHDKVDEYIDMVEAALLSCHTHGEMLNKVAGIIGKIADIDDTVNHDIQAVNIF